MTANNETETINLLEDFMAKGDWEFIESAIKNGTNINALDGEGHTLLSCALYANQPEDVKKLIELGSDVNTKLGINFNALSYAGLLYAQKKFSINPEIISLLINAGSDLNDAMLIGLRAGSVEFVDLLIKNGADINGNFAYDKTPLALTMMSSPNSIKPEILDYLAQNGANLDERFKFDDGATATALSVCISIERPDLMKILLNNGADPNLQDHKGRTALIFAILTGLEYVDILLEYGADPNIPDKEGRIPLMLAAIEGTTDIAIIESLINAGTNLNAQDKRGLTALMWTVVSQDRSPDFVISALIRTGGFRTEKAEKWFGLAAMYAAAKRETQLEILRLLIEHGADVNIQNKKGISALAYAVADLDDEITGILASAGAKIL